MQHPISKLGDPVVDILDFTNEYTVMPLDDGRFDKPDAETSKIEDFIENFFRINYPATDEDKALQSQESNSKLSNSLKYKCQARRFIDVKT